LLVFIFFSAFCRIYLKLNIGKIKMSMLVNKQNNGMWEYLCPTDTFLDFTLIYSSADFSKLKHLPFHVKCWILC
jgi:hypothetical protein